MECSRQTFEGSEWYQIDPKWLRGHSCSFRTNFVSFRTFRHPRFPKPVSWLGLFCRLLQLDGSTSFIKRYFSKSFANYIGLSVIKGNDYENPKKLANNKVSFGKMQASNHGSEAVFSSSSLAGPPLYWPSHPYGPSSLYRPSENKKIKWLKLTINKVCFSKMQASNHGSKAILSTSSGLNGPFHGSAFRWFGSGAGIITK